MAQNQWRMEADRERQVACGHGHWRGLLYGALQRTGGLGYGPRPGRHWWKMNKEQKRLARHALGLPNKKNKSYRNYFYCLSDKGVDFDNWMAMAQMKIATKLKGANTFILTWKGAHLALEPGESLNPEDFTDRRTKA